MRIRLKYSVNGRIRFISHLDLMRVFFRACMRKNIPVAVSKGYSPHLKLSFGPPRGLGISSSCEYLDIYLEKPIIKETIKNNLQEAMPEGIGIKELIEIPKSEPALTAVINEVLYSVEIPKGEYIVNLENKIKNLLNKNEIIIERVKKQKRGNKKEKKIIDIRPLIHRLELKEDKKLLIYVSTGQKGSVRPLEIIKLLWPELVLDELKLWKIHREKLLGCEI